MRWGWLVMGGVVAVGGCGESTASSDARVDASADAQVGTDGPGGADASPPVDGPSDRDASQDAAAAACALDAPVGTHVTLVASDTTRQLRSYVVSRDSTVAAVVGDLELDNVVYVYAVRLDGGPLVRLSHAYGYPELVLGVRVTDDGQNVVFIADPGALGRYRLYRAPITGGSITTLYEGPEQVFTIDVTNERVLFQTRRSGYPPVLRSVPITGGEVATLSHGTHGYDSMERRITPDGTRVLYVEHDPASGRMLLYSVPLAGGPITELAPGVTVALYDAQLTPDGAHLTFRGLPASDTASLYSVPVAGGEAVPFFTQPWRFGATLTWQLSPDGSFAAVISDFEQPDLYRLYVVPRAGGTPLALSQDPLGDDRLDVAQVAIAPDGSRVVFAGDPEWPDVGRVYSVAVAGGPIATLSQNVGVTGDLDAHSPIVTPDGANVIFGGDALVDGVDGIYSVPIGGGTAQTLSPPYAAWGPVVTPRDVVYRGNAAAAGPTRVYRNGLDGSGPEAVSIDPGSDPQRYVSSFEVTADGCWVVYDGPVETDATRLYARKIR